MLNRGYANESRNKKLSGDERLKLENSTLEAQTEATLEELDHVQFVEFKSLDHREQKLKREIEEMKSARPDLSFSDLSDISSDENSGQPFKKYRYEEIADYKDLNHETKKMKQLKHQEKEEDILTQEVLKSRTHFLDEEEAELLAQSEILAHLEKHSDENIDKNHDDQNSEVQYTTSTTESGNRMAAAKMNFGLQEGTAVVGPSALNFKARLNEFRKCRRELPLDQWLKMKQESEILDNKKKSSNWQTNEDEGSSTKTGEDTDAMDRAIQRSLSHEES